MLLLAKRIVAVVAFPFSARSISCLDRLNPRCDWPCHQQHSFTLRWAAVFHCHHARKNTENPASADPGILSTTQLLYAEAT